jgi:Ca2+:H+ antiporter
LPPKAILLASEDPELSQWVAIGMLLIAIGLMAATAELLVDSIEFAQEDGNISVE